MCIPSCESRLLTFIPILKPKTAAYRQLLVEYLQTLWPNASPTSNTTTRIKWGRQTTFKHAMVTSNHDALYLASLYPVTPMSVSKRYFNPDDLGILGRFFPLSYILLHGQSPCIDGSTTSPYVSSNKKMMSVRTIAL